MVKSNVVRGLFAGMAALIVLTGCSEGNADEPARSPEAVTQRPELVIFVYDRSTSIPDYQLNLAKELTDARIDVLEHGDKIAALQVLQLSLAEPPERWSQTVPKKEWTEQEIARDSVTRTRFLRDAQAYLVAFTDTAGRDEIDGTDLLSTLHDVGAELRGAPSHEATLYMFSDMLQSNRQIDMEGLRHMPPSGWIHNAASKGMLPNLKGLCVVVIGARVDNEHSQRVRKFWQEYFEVTGASLQDHNYMHRPVKLPEHPCP